MAIVWLPFFKLIEYVEVFLNSKKTVSCLCKNNNIELKLTRKEPVFMISSVLKSLEKRDKANVLHNFVLATIALKDGNIEKSTKMLVKTLDLAEKSDLVMESILACDVLSSLAMKMGDFEKAEDFLIRALDNMTRHGTPEDNPFVLSKSDQKLITLAITSRRKIGMSYLIIYIQTFRRPHSGWYHQWKNTVFQFLLCLDMNHKVSFNLKLCRIYSTTENDELAEIGFKNCLHIQNQTIEKLSNEDSILLFATILFWYGKFLLKKKNFVEAKNCFKNCFLTSSKVKKIFPSQMMVILYNLGEACQGLGQLDEAFGYLIKGLTLDEKEQNVDVSYFYVKLGMISMSRGMYKEAKIWCDRGQKIAAKYGNSDAEKESNDCLRKLNNILNN